MTELAWLAALVSPRSVAPHVNFQSVDKVTPAGLLALVVQNREHDLARVQDRLTRPLTETEQTLVRAASGLFENEGIHNAVPVLAELAAGRPTEPAIATASCLLAALGFAELDMHLEAVELLRTVDVRVDGSDHDESLLRGVLKQQAAMRAFEVGQPFEQDRDAAREYLSSVVPTELSRYPTSRGSKWTALGTNRQIAAALLESNQDLFDSEVFFPDARTLQSWLRRPHSDLVSACLLSEASGLTAYVDEQFSQIARTSERTFRSEDPVDSPVWKSLTFFEFIGHARQARARRGALGKLRLVRFQAGETFHIRESLRLLRHAGDLKNLRLALNHTRTHGPLAGLQTEAQQVVARRLAPGLLKDVELAVLESGAQVLDRTAASAALGAVFEALNSPVALGRRGELPAIHTENLLRAAAALASVAGREDQLASQILDHIQGTGPISDQLLSNAHARGLASMDWDNLPSAIKSRWLQWASDADQTVGWDSVVDLVLPRVRKAQGKRNRHTDSLTLSEIANELNAVMAGSRPPRWLKAEGEPLLHGVLDRARSEASHGQITFYGADLADLAACMNLHLGSDLWAPLVDFLLTTPIPHSQKAAALNRLASDPEAVPDEVRAALAARRGDLLAKSALTSPFDPPEPEPFPAAVRFLASMGALSEEELLEAMTTLGAGQVRDRLEASRTLAVITKYQPAVGQWVVTSALQLSNDIDATVRAETGRAIAQVLTRTDFANGLLTERLLRLLDEDGILVPLLVLQGMTMNDSDMTPDIESKVRQMGLNHPASVVRSQAGALLAQQGELT